MGPGHRGFEQLVAQHETAVGRLDHAFFVGFKVDVAISDAIRPVTVVEPPAFRIAPVEIHHRRQAHRGLLQMIQVGDERHRLVFPGKDHRRRAKDHVADEHLLTGRKVRGPGKIDVPAERKEVAQADDGRTLGYVQDGFDDLDLQVIADFTVVAGDGAVVEGSFGNRSLKARSVETRLHGSALVRRENEFDVSLPGPVDYSRSHVLQSRRSDPVIVSRRRHQICPFRLSTWNDGREHDARRSRLLTYELHYFRFQFDLTAAS